ncbi:transcriptional regulator GlxA family with amidase domain [Arthrobacter woluwensis]|uniref:GlxA family transcriptional regulator n=1 Tax=Arthrobacter woluwensis TaxID=156980 RepID=UPI002783262F|nr:helix-turn-helix domain-containing protein [Arthrobacter woluwensis]MDQ0710094.1 transcriptional regulator GlxA family with amidase domain [Arthrobacter woluwensis]
MQNIVTVAVPGAPLFELGIPSRIFGAARDAAGAPLYDVAVVSADGKREVVTAEGLTLTTEPLEEKLRSADVVIVSSSESLLDPTESDRLARGLETLLGETATPRGRRIASICSGAFLLGSLGLLDGRAATTHWRHGDLLARRHPSVAVQPEALFVDEGEVLTSAGVAAGLDLCLHLIRTDHGTRIANAVARACIVAPFREGGQAQYIETPVGGDRGPATAGLVEWLLGHLELHHTTASLAERAHLSARTFERRFAAEQGMPPGRWLIQARVKRAKEYLESTELSVEAIARAVGMGTGANLRTHFKRCTGRSLQDYRKLFSAGGPGTVRRP